MGKFFGVLILVLIIAGSGAYFYYSQTGYKFGLDDSFLFQNTIGITSPNFGNGAQIDSQFTCDGSDESPEFALSRVPKDTQSLAIVLEDSDTKPTPFTHWLAYNIDPSVMEVSSFSLWQNAILGTNDFGNTDYNGPCPPAGTTHKYVFRVYALNTKLDVQNLSRFAFDKGILDHVLSSGMIIGVYTKKP